MTTTTQQAVALAREAGFDEHEWRQLRTDVVLRLIKLARNQALEEAKQVAQQKAETIWEFHPEEVKQAAHNVCANIANAIASLKDNTL